MNIREIILDILLDLEKTDGYANILLAAVLDKYDYLTAQEKAFIKRVTEGTIERRIQLDYIIDTVSKVPVKKMKPLIRQLMRMSAYQILFMDAVPDSAVCNEAVKLAKKRKFTSLQGFVNGVLRNLTKQKDNVAYPDPEKETVSYLSVMYSMPEWLTEHFLQEYTKEIVEKIFASFLEQSPVTLRIEEDMPQAERDKLLASWEKKGAVIKKHPYLPYAVQVQRSDGIRQLAGYEEGLFTVQDVSSMLVVEAADIKKGSTVIDVCAAPGGKSLHAASKLGGTGRVLSYDVTEAKVERLEENRRRMRAENMVTAVGDAGIENKELLCLADVVLADVPCSGLGVIGKKQDIKYHVTPESICEITALQKDILKNAAAYVKPGGILMYSTCTINRMENEEMVRWFCDLFPFEPESMEEYMPEPLKDAAAKGMLQLLPGIHRTDGFFFARLRRSKQV